MPGDRGGWLLFLFNWRAALISSLAIPLSLVCGRAGTCTGEGGTINTMVLAGLIIALGEVVDDAIIDVENILRRLRLNREISTTRIPAFRVVYEASIEVRSAVVYATLIVVLTLVPVFFLEGLAGSFFDRWRRPTSWRLWHRWSSRSDRDARAFVDAVACETAERQRRTRIADHCIAETDLWRNVAATADSASDGRC